MAEIVIERISKTYSGGKTPAVDDVSLTIRDREFMVLLGPSGCGKTTLLRMIAGLESPERDRKSTRLNSSHRPLSRMPSSA